MVWRKWLVRSLVFSVLGLAALAVGLYFAWTNPSAVRSQTLAKLSSLFVGANVSLESARLRLLGGIVVRELRMVRRGDLDRGDFLYVPSAVIYHDKEHLLDGSLSIRKVELDRPRLRIVRERDGRINLAGGLLTPPDLHEFVPTIVIRHGTILLEDRAASPQGVLVEIKDVTLTLTNDPISTLVIEGTGQTDVLGPVRLRARYLRANDAASAVVNLPDVPVGLPLVQRLGGYCPDAVSHLRELSGAAKVQVAVTHRPDAVEPWSYDLLCELNRGEWRPDCLPMPLERIQASLRCINGRIPHAKLQARSENATVAVDLWDVAWPAHPPKCIEDVAARIAGKVEHLDLTPRFFDHLPLACQGIRDTFKPAGPVSLSYDYQRSGNERWEKHWKIQPEGMTALFKGFPYPLTDVSGEVLVDFYKDHADRIRVDLLGRGADRSVTVRGSIIGDKFSEVDLVVAADDVPVDNQLLAALPAKSREQAGMFLPSRSRELGLPEQPLGLVQPAGAVNVKVFVRRARGQESFNNRYVLTFHDTSLKYDLFPYPLENVSGVLDIQPDHWECQNFHGSHKGGEIWVNACSFREDAAVARAVVAAKAEGDDGLPPECRSPQRECVQVGISGKNILLDEEFEQALSPPGVSGRAALRNAWSMLALRGRLSFESAVVDRPDQPQDLDVTVGINGCTMQPDFFRYPMTDVAARVRYVKGHVYLQKVSARHEGCRLGMREATVELKPAGGFRAWFQGIRGDDLLPDDAFLRALHPALRRGLEPLQIKNPVQVETDLTLDAPAVPGEPMKIWWKGGVRLHKQVFQAGVEIKDVEGVIQCKGHHNGRQFEYLTGHAVLERARILGQPFTNLKARIDVTPETPEVLSLYDLSANLFGGFIGGEARFVFGPPLRYDVKLDALNVSLEQFGRYNQLGADARIQGPVKASVHLKGEGNDLSGLKGNGSVEVANGKLYRLPLLLDLLKAFGLRLPDRTAFEQAAMIFAIEGPQMRIHKLDLLGSAISLRGQGTLNIVDGSNLNLDFSADWGRMPQLLPTGISDLTQAMSDKLLKIKLRGKISAPRFEKEFMPGVVEPIKKAFSP